MSGHEIEVPVVAELPRQLRRTDNVGHEDGHQPHRPGSPAGPLPDGWSADQRELGEPVKDAVAHVVGSA
jgi:hypothetical protein